ncbi:MAG: alanine--tRNA ligase [Armatimonadota bacterium]
MTSSELRTAYLKFFESKKHLIHPSDSLVPNDPSLLYTAAGMVQFKPYFIGDRVPPAPRLVTSQKCMRTDDVEEVGDAVHHTFFEMLGNFSFGDYFKREAITWAWEFLTDALKLNPDNLWTSIYLDDDEAYDIWVNEVGFPKERIVRLGEDKNYWPANAPTMGPNGPCGPCNEIFLDVNPEAGAPEDPAWSIAHDGNRFVEIWNLVFQQFDRQEDGTLDPLPTKNIDTGMGLERTIAILNNAPSNYDTDLFQPIIKAIEKITGASYGKDEETTRAIRVIADHIRGAVFAIADGVMPSNIGRGYVLRRIIRRAVLRGNSLGVDKPFLHELVGVVADLMKDVYTEPKDRQDYVTSLIKAEEEKFLHTLDSGMSRLMQQIEDVKKSGGNLLPGDAAFSLHDTYGFPLELTQEIAQSEGIEVDVAGFETAMEDQRKRAKESSDFAASLFGGGNGAILELEQTVPATEFVGYHSLKSDAKVLAILERGEQISVAKEGNLVDLVLDRTPFYAESGGQVGDEGQIMSRGAMLRVKNTVKAAHVFLHAVEVVSGEIKVGDDVHCEVDVERRMAIARNHTATHLLHAALRHILGPHALQAGSVVEPGRLRFDFSHFQAVTSDELRQIEDEVNDKILADLPVEVTETNIDEARKMGAMALFGEKYGKHVRVMKVGDYSTELCGGTHLSRTSQVGLFKLVSESSVGAGLRRIEAVTGSGAVQHVHDIEDLLHEVSEKLGSSPLEAASAIERLQTNLKETQRKIEQIQAKSAAEQSQELAAAAHDISGVNLVANKVQTANAQVLSALADGIADKLKSGVVVLGGVGDGKVLFISKVTPDLVKRGFHAGNLIREVAKVAGGGGGGRPEFAQAGGRDASKVDEALQTAVELVRKQAG